MNNEILNNNLYKLFDNCEPNENQNVVISGLSIKMAFAMLLNGADGKSKEELETFLGNNREEINGDSSRILSECGDDLMLANAFWFSKPNRIKWQYKKTIKKYQKAVTHVDDFDLESTLNKINTWVSNNTNGLIERLLEELSSETTSLLINTLYFKAQWSEPFLENSIQDIDFKGTKETRLVKMMRKIVKEYFENEYAKGFRLYYKDSPYEFIGILPNKEGNFRLQELNLNSFKQMDGEYRVHLTFPKLDIDYSVSLKDAIQGIGINAPFNNEYDFNTMLSIPQKVSKVIHKTKFKLDEKGTEAAAASVIQMMRSAVMHKEPPKDIELVFDRPFAFMIKHRETNDLLFIGKICNL